MLLLMLDYDSPSQFLIWLQRNLEASKNSLFTFVPDFAEVSMKYFIPFSLAKDCAIAFETFLSYSRSDLLPTRNSMTSGQHCSLTSRIHVLRLSKVARSVIEYPKITASADRQKIFVIDLKDSQPAVSQICNFRTVSSTLMRQEPKSTPTVTLCSVSNESFVSLVSTHDLPIPKFLRELFQNYAYLYLLGL